MSTEQLPEPPRTVSKTIGRHLNTEMHGIGLLMAAILLVLVLPLLPFIALVWLVARLSTALRRTVSGDEPAGRPGSRRPRAM